jgi:hypothetical protein
MPLLQTADTIRRLIRNVRETQHQNLELGHAKGENLKNQQKSTLAFKEGGSAETQNTINFRGKLSFILSFLFSERLHCCYIYFHWSYLYN